MTTSTKKRLKQFLAERVGEAFEMRELQAEVDGPQLGRRLRELREEGWNIISHKDSDELKPGQYKVVGMPSE